MILPRYPNYKDSGVEYWVIYVIHVLLGPAQLYEALRERPAARESSRFPMQ